MGAFTRPPGVERRQRGGWIFKVKMIRFSHCLKLSGEEREDPGKNEPGIEKMGLALWGGMEFCLEQARVEVP